ncbi:MAG TPA: hypothetical protein VF113_02725 [Stellaceae bacterium]
MLGTRIFGAFGLLLLAACGGAQKTHAPDGREAYILQCRGGGYACAQQAGDLCGARGYQVLDPAGRAIPPQAPLGSISQLMITCGATPGMTLYGGESHAPPQSGGETASKLLNQSQQGGATTPR